MTETAQAVMTGLEQGYVDYIGADPLFDSEDAAPLHANG